MIKNEQEKDDKILKLKAQVKRLKKQNRHYWDAWWGIDKEYEILINKNKNLTERLSKSEHVNKELSSRINKYFNNNVVPLRAENEELKKKIKELKSIIKETDEYRQTEKTFRKCQDELKEKLRLINEQLSEYFE